MDNNLNLTNNGFNSDLQSQTTYSRSENSNINYHNNANTPCDYNNGYPMTNGGVAGVFPASYINTPAYTNAPGNVIISDLPQTYTNASSNSSHPPQYNGQNATQFIQNNSSLFNSLNTTNSSQINHSDIFTFDIPGIKIIILPTFPPMTYSSQANHSEIFTFEIPGSKVIIITLSFQ
jgi:predicted ribonuclease toxin of YeeF-YezG toxin-antitoxin module